VTNSLLLVDDKKEALNALAAELATALPTKEGEIRLWVPSDKDHDPRASFFERVDDTTTLVVADHDLTSSGRTGLFGSSIVAWCQERAIPVVDFSRAPDTSLPREPELFELRIPLDPEKAVPSIVALFRGFKAITDALRADPDLLALRGAAAVLSRILGVPESENQLSLYAVRLGPTSGSLMARISGDQPSDEQKRALLGYIAGHLLLTVLRFPGPIISTDALKAYLASDEANSRDVTDLFKKARYFGPFGDLEPFFWLTKVNAELEKLIPEGADADTVGELHRTAIEARLQRKLRQHDCPRCHGKNGGYYCPFTKRTVCQLPYCSVGANSWIPPGASICRIEREFFDEWGPVLGL